MSTTLDATTEITHAATSALASGSEQLGRELRTLLKDDVAHLVKGAPSIVVSDARLYGVGLLDSAGNVVAANNSHVVGSFTAMARHALDRFETELDAGGLVATNDPYAGGSHITALMLIRRVANLDEPLYIAVRLPTADVGGERIGGINPRALEVWEEGARIPPVLLRRGGAPDDRIETLLALNSRFPDLLRNDLHAAVSTMAAIERHLFEWSTVRQPLAQAAAALLDESELVTEEAIAGLKAGSWSSSVEIRHCCTSGTGEVKATLEVADGTVTLDLTESSAPMAGFVNGTEASTLTAVSLALAGLRPRGQVDSGMLRRVRLLLPEASIVNADLPHATGWSLYGNAGSVARLTADLAEKAGLRRGDFEAWLNPPRLVFATPPCDDPRCPYAPVERSGGYASRYTREW